LAKEKHRMTSTYHHVLLVMHRFKIPLILAAAVMLAFSAFALEAIEHDPKFTTVAQRFQADFGVSLKLAQVDDAFFAKNHVVSPLKPEHLDYALQITARKLLLLLGNCF